LNDREQFIGHQVHSHELSIEEAGQAWYLTTALDSNYYQKEIGGYQK
jgi:hypothetical protein